MKYFIGFLLSSILLFGGTIELAPITVTGSSDSFVNNDYKIVKPLEEVESRVVIQETVPGFSQPIINGLMGDKVLLTLDGIKFSNSLFRAGPNQYYSWIPKEFIIDAKLNNKLSGITSSSLGGSIDRTLGIDDSKVGVSYKTNNQGHKEVFKYKNKEYQIGIINNDTQNVRTPDGEVAHSAYNQKGIFLRKKHLDYGDTKFVFTKSDDIDRTDKFENNDYYVYELQQYTLITHTYWLEDTNFMIVPSIQQFKEKIDRDSPTSKDIDSTNNMFGLQMVGYYEPTFSDSAYITYGVTDSFEDIDYKKGTIQNIYNYNIFSAYVTYNDDIGRKIDYDIKYKYSAMKATGGGLNRTLDNHSFGFDTKYKIGYLHNIFLKGDMNYKFPTINNLATAQEGSVVEIPNSDLEQEKAYTLEVGYYNDGLSIKIFYKKLEDMIIREQTNISDGNGGYMWKYQNTDNGYIKGINTEYSKKFNNGYGIFLFGEYLDGKTDYDYISKLTPLKFKSKGSKDIKLIEKDKIFIEWLYAPKVDDDKMALKDKTDIRIQEHNNGYNIVNFGYETISKKKHKVEIELTNIFNTTGRVYGSSVDFGERGIYLSYSYLY